DEVARAGRVGAMRLQHLEELAADRKDEVGQAEDIDAGVVMALLEPEHLLQLGDDRGVLVRDEGDLTKAHRGYSATSRSATSASTSSVCSTMRGGWRRTLAGVFA